MGLLFHNVPYVPMWFAGLYILQKPLKFKIMAIILLIGLGISTGLLGWCFWRAFQNNN